MTYRREKPVNLNVGELALLVKMIASRVGDLATGTPGDMDTAGALFGRIEELCVAWGVEAQMVRDLAMKESPNALWAHIEAEALMQRNTAVDSAPKVRREGVKEKT